MFIVQVIDPLYSVCVSIHNTWNLASVSSQMNEPDLFSTIKIPKQDTLYSKPSELTKY